MGRHTRSALITLLMASSITSLACAAAVTTDDPRAKPTTTKSDTQRPDTKKQGDSAATSKPASQPTSRPNAPDKGDKDKKAASKKVAPIRAKTREALIRKFIEALAEGDREKLLAMRVTKKCYVDQLFPGFRKFKKANNSPVDFHWYMLNTHSVAGALDLIGEFKGKKLELIEISGPQRIDDYETFKLHCQIRVRLRVEGVEMQKAIRLFGSLVELNGEFAILSYPS